MFFDMQVNLLSDLSKNASILDLRPFIIASLAMIYEHFMNP